MSLDSEAKKVKCEDCPEPYKIPRPYKKQVQYVLDRIDAKVYKSMKVINLDDEALPLAEEKRSSKDGKYFVTSLLTKSKMGLRLIIYAGERGKSVKTQVFVEPEIKRLAFDQKDLHPNDVFTSVEAIFEDKSSVKLSKRK